MKLNILTQNKFKIETAKTALSPFRIDVRPISLDLPEIQAATNLEIARDQAVKASKMINQPIAREDHGLFLEALSGLPGPYMALVEKQLQPATVLKLTQENNQGYFMLSLVYAKPNGETIELESKVDIEITSLKNNNLAYSTGSWDSIISIKGDSRVLADYPASKRYHYFSSNYHRLGKMLSEKR